MSLSAARLPLAGGAFLALADTGIVALALPPLLVELDTSIAGVAAVLGVYAVVLAAALPPAEWLRRVRGTGVVGAAGVLLFALGSLVCGLAGSLPLLLAARALQATGGAAVLVTAYALLADRGAGTRLWRLAALLGTAAGPALGGALTQALGWRAIFLAQAPAALAALPACLAAARRVPGDAARTADAARPARSADTASPARAPAEDRRAPAGLARTVADSLALALLSGALAAALFLTVLLLVSGWSVEPLAAAAAVSVIPLAAFASARIEGPPIARAAGGCLLVLAGAAALAFMPGASLAWTIPPQLLVGLGMGLALPALAGELLPERSGRQAARLLTLRHAGIALALLLLAPIAQRELDGTLGSTRERGAALILDARIDPGTKLDIAPELAANVETEDPRGGLDDVFEDGRAGVAEEELPAYDALRERVDETLVAAVVDGFAPAFLAGAALALLAALVLAPRAAVLHPRPAAALAAAALVAPGAYALLAEAARPPPVEIADPCQARELPRSGGATGLLQDAALIALDELACQAGSSREELVLALVDDAEATRYERRYGVDPRSALDLAGLALGG